jgi:hypothetical protein
VPPPRRRPCDDLEQFYAYVWRLDDVVIWVGQGHGLRGVPSRRNVTGRPEDLVELLNARWQEIQMEAFPCNSQEEARRLEVSLTVKLLPLYNEAVGFAGFKGRTHSESTKSQMSSSNTGRPASDLCKQKSSERMTERNRTNPPRKGKTCSKEHRRKLSEAAKQRRRKCT